MNFLPNHIFKTKTKKIIFLGLLCFCLMHNWGLHAQKKYVVVLDAGHGGKDPGNLGNGVQRKKYSPKSSHCSRKSTKKAKGH